MDIKEEAIKLINACIEEAKQTERIELDIKDLSNLLNGKIMCVEFDTPIKYLELSFNEEVIRNE